MRMPSDVLKPMTFAAPACGPTDGVVRSPDDDAGSIAQVRTASIRADEVAENEIVNAPRIARCSVARIETPAVAFDTRIFPALELVPPIVLLDDSMTIPVPSKLATSTPSIVLAGALGATSGRWRDP